MKTETIDKFLDECGITPSPWEARRDDFYDEGVYQIMHQTARNVHGQFGETNGKENASLVAASREMLKALIESTLFIEKIMYDVRPNLWSDVISQGYKSYESGKSAIISALPGKPWPEILKRMEELDD